MYSIRLTRSAEKEYIALAKSNPAIFKRVKAALEYIAEKAVNNPQRAVRIWEMGTRILKAEGKNRMDISDVKKALVLSI